MLFIPVQGVDLSHFLIGQREAVKLCIFLDMLRIAGTGDDHHAFLQIPAEDHLGGGGPMGFCDIGDYLVPQQLRRMTPATQGIPALDQGITSFRSGWWRSIRST